MTQEEKLQLLKQANIKVEGDLVLEKHVDYEIGYIEEGGIGFQVNNISEPAEHRQHKNGNHSDAQRHLNDTFTYKYLSIRDGRLRLVKLYQTLINEKCGWLDEDVTPDTWCALFQGEPKAFIMKWRGTQQHLYYLFKTLIGRGLIEKPNGVGQWEIIGSHFVNQQSRPFTCWNGQKDPIKAQKVISQLADILDISKPLSEDED